MLSEFRARGILAVIASLVSTRRQNPLDCPSLTARIPALARAVSEASTHYRGDAQKKSGCKMSPIRPMGASKSVVCYVCFTSTRDVARGLKCASNVVRRRHGELAQIDPNRASSVGEKSRISHGRDDVCLDLARHWSRPELLGDCGCRSLCRFRQTIRTVGLDL